MNIDIKKKWVKALRSNRYKQGRFRLESIRENGLLRHCCLGVLCRVMRVPVYQKANGDILDTEFGNKDFTCRTSLLDEVSCKAGLTSVAENKLIKMNDDKQLSFKEIADYIEENL